MQLAVHNTLRRPAGRGAPPRAGLVDRPDEGAYDSLLDQARRLLNVPIAQLFLEGEDRRIFKPPARSFDPWGWDGQTPRRHSFAHRIAAAGKSATVTDAREHTLIKRHEAVLDAGALALASVPLVTLEGFVIGAIAVMDSQPRRWSALEMQLLDGLAASVMTDLETRRTCEQQYRMRSTPRFDIASRCA